MELVRALVVRVVMFRVAVVSVRTLLCQARVLFVAPFPVSLLLLVGYDHQLLVVGGGVGVGLALM